MQVADLALDIIGSPDWVLRTIALVLALGFPVSLVLAWAFELTPEGLSKNVENSDARDRLPPNRGNTVIIGLMALAVGFLFVDRYFLPASETDIAPGEDSEVPYEVLSNSVAILPFENLSVDL